MADPIIGEKKFNGWGFRKEIGIGEVVIMLSIMALLVSDHLKVKELNQGQKAILLTLDEKLSKEEALRLSESLDRTDVSLQAQINLIVSRAADTEKRLYELNRRVP